MSEAEGMCSIPAKLACTQDDNRFVATLTIDEGSEAIVIEIGSLNMQTALENDDLRKEFIALMRKVVLHIVEYNGPGRVEFVNDRRN